MHLIFVNPEVNNLGFPSVKPGKVTDMSSFTFQNIVGLHQRMSKRFNDKWKGSPDQIIMPRPVIGLYKKHARADLVTWNLLQLQARMGLPFHFIDVDFMFSTFHRDTPLNHLQNSMPLLVEI